MHAEAASLAPTPASSPRPRTNNPSQRSPSQTGSQASDRLRAGQRNRTSTSPQQQQQQNKKKNAQHGGGGNRNNQGERRNKRLPSVLDASSASRPAKNTSRGMQQKNLPAPLPVTDWNSPLFSKPGFERLLASAPRASSIFTPNLTASASPTPAAAGGKGKGKAAASSAPKVANAKPNLPGIKTAVSALKLHIRPGGRNILGPLNNPIAIAGGSLTQNRVVTLGQRSTDDTSLAADLKAARIALQNEKIGGSYERFGQGEVLKAAGVKAKEGGSVQSKALQDAAQALAVNADLAPEGKNFVAKTIAERLSA